MINTITALYGAGLVAVGGIAYFLGQKKEQNKSKNFTIKEDVIKPEPKVEKAPEQVAPQPRPEAPVEPETKLFPITDAINTTRGAGEYNKLIGQMRFDGYQTLAFAVSGYNTKFDYMTPIKSNPNQKFAVILDEAQSNPETVNQVQKELAEFDTSNVRLYTLAYQG